MTPEILTIDLSPLAFQEPKGGYYYSQIALEYNRDEVS